MAASEAKAKVRPLERPCKLCGIAEAPRGGIYCGPCRRVATELPLSMMAPSLGVHLYNLEQAIKAGDTARALKTLEMAMGLRDALETATEDACRVSFYASCRCGRRYTSAEYTELQGLSSSRHTIKLCLCGGAL
jgi:hypothetical protein